MSIKHPQVSVSGNFPCSDIIEISDILTKYIFEILFSNTPGVECRCRSWRDLSGMGQSSMSRTCGEEERGGGRLNILKGQDEGRSSIVERLRR